jgi:hypothetical protein
MKTKCKFPKKKKYLDVNEAYYTAKSMNRKLKVPGRGLKEYRCADHWHIGDIHKMR